MFTLPPAFEERIKIQLGEEAGPFLSALQKNAETSIRLNPGKSPSPDGIFPSGELDSRIPWCREGFFLKGRPLFTLDPLLHAGAYYVQEASSMFLQHILRQTLPEGPVRVLDLCAAPGGKSTLIASLLGKDSLLVSNEVIRSRASILKENIIKWGQDNVVVTNNDPADFKGLVSAFDLILVDAPCSGEGMFRKDITAVEEWSTGNTRLCSERQKRILTDIWDSLRPEGILVYSTCTYNPEEDEGILEWMLENFACESVGIQGDFPEATRGRSPADCRHFYPHRTRGEGFFIGALRKLEGSRKEMRRNRKGGQSRPVILPQEVKALLPDGGDFSLYLSGDRAGMVRSSQADFVRLLEQQLRVLYKGVEIAETAGRKFRLLPAFALWQGLDHGRCTCYDADLKTALSFLSREDIPAPASPAGWVLVRYKGRGLGWCKNLGNRMNNHWPKEWRIRMRTDI